MTDSHSKDFEILKQLILAKALIRGKVTLASGKTSDYYLDLRRITLDPLGLEKTCKLFWHQLQSGAQVSAVGGPTLGADPITAGLVLLSQWKSERNEGRAWKGYIIRKEPKKHGTEVWVEGLDALEPAACVALVEDVVTTAGSSIRAIDRAEAAGLQVKRVLCLIDRGEGGKENLKEKGYDLESIFHVSDLL